MTPALAPCNDPACVYCLCHAHPIKAQRPDWTNATTTQVSWDPLRAPGTDDYILGLYAPDRPRSAAAGIIIAAAVVVIVGLLVALFLATA